VADLDQLGAGFAISQRDLDLRGGGDLLGDVQAGHIKSIGVELYRYLLQQALEGSPAPPAAEVNLGLPAAIGADYVSEPDARINLYARLARLRDLAQLDDFADEIEERFGPMPPAMANLLAVKRIAETAASLKISRIDAGPNGVVLATSRRLDRQGWQRNGQRYFITVASGEEQRINTVLRLLEDVRGNNC
jgi:transcription-repair coupling factor (superfamily II helicase)